jgi:regulator of sigma E protease
MSIIIFIIILGVLILVHEFGHFIVAIKSGIKVSEFGIGFPPKIVKLFRWRETDFTLNAIPFGGFVKIFGENPEEESISGPDSSRSFVNKPRWIQALVLVAGVSFNIIFAWILISVGFMYGLPTPVDYGGSGVVKNPQVVITTVGVDSPAYLAGIKTGDVIKKIGTENIAISDLTPEIVSDFIKNTNTEKIDVVYSRGQNEFQASITPVEGIVEGKKAIGVSMDYIGILRLPVHLAFWEGLKTTGSLLVAVTSGLALFLLNTITFNADFSQVTGPVGIVGMVGDVSNLGFIYLLSFTAFISLNLAVINLIPFPALDGGRLLFVLIETIIRKPISPKVANTFNGVGFLLLILLMLVVTVNDVVKLF